MAVIFQPDPSLAGFNSFISVSEADDYFVKRLHDSGWNTALKHTKEASLMWATLQLNNLAWKGARTSGTQPLAFPRVGLSYAESGNMISGEFYDIGLGFYTLVMVSSTTIPQEVKNATAELALWLIASDTTAPTGLEGFKSLKVESIQIEVLAKDRPNWMNESVYNLCKRFLLNSNKYSAQVVRVG